jgi:hypothetical protein
MDGYTSAYWRAQPEREPDQNGTLARILRRLQIPMGTGRWSNVF